MIEPKFEVPAELRELAEKTIDQAEKAFGMFFEAAGKSITSVPSPGTEISKQALSLTEQNLKAAFDHARKLVHATDLQEAMRIQSEFLKSQFTNAGEHMRQMMAAGRPENAIRLAAFAIGSGIVLRRATRIRFYVGCRKLSSADRISPRTYRRGLKAGTGPRRSCCLWHRFLEF
jgi:phasin